MNLTNEFEPIREWAQEKGIVDNGDVKTQALKLVEEVGELAKAILKDDIPEIEDGIGDCGVVLTNLAKLVAKKYGIETSFESCVNGAYLVIKNRKGRMIEGTFVKD